MGAPADGSQTKKLHTYALDELIAGLRQKGYQPSPQGLLTVDLVMAKTGAPDVLVEVKAMRDIRLVEVGEKLAAAALRLVLAAKTWPDRWGRPQALIVIVVPLMTDTVWAFIEKHIHEVIRPVYGALRFDMPLTYAAFDRRGLFRSTSHLLDAVTVRPADDLPGAPSEAPKVVDLFSGLGQWQLKLLLGQHLDPSLITVPRGDLRNASVLAGYAEVSKANSYKLVNALKEDHFLTEDLKPVRVPELLNRWAPHGSRTTHETAVAPILPTSDPDAQLDALLQKVAPLKEGPWVADRWHTPFRVAVAGIAAADRLGAGHVRGVKPVLYMDRVTDESLRALGLKKIKAGSPFAYLVRRPKFADAVFNAAVAVNGVPVTDILQTYLDVQQAPRGEEQAGIIMDHVIAEAFAGKDD